MGCVYIHRSIGAELSVITVIKFKYKIYKKIERNCLMNSVQKIWLAL